MPEDPIQPEPVAEPARATEPVAQPAAVTQPIEPVVGTAPAATPAPVVTAGTRRGPWWEYLAVGLAGVLVGAVLFGTFITIVSHVRHGRGDDHGRFQRFDRRDGQYGPRQFGPGQNGPGLRYNGPGNNGGNNQPVPAPTATG